MVKPEAGFNEAVRARVIELTGKDPGAFRIGDIFPGPNYHNTSFADRVEAIAQSMVRSVPMGKLGDTAILD